MKLKEFKLQPLISSVSPSLALAPSMALGGALLCILMVICVCFY